MSKEKSRAHRAPLRWEPLDRAPSTDWAAVLDCRTRLSKRVSD